MLQLFQLQTQAVQGGAPEGRIGGCGRQFEEIMTFAQMEGGDAACPDCGSKRVERSLSAFATGGSNAATGPACGAAGGGCGGGGAFT